MQERHQQLFKILIMGNILKTLHALNFYWCQISDYCPGNFYPPTNDCESEKTVLLLTGQFLVQQSHSDGRLWWMWIAWLDCSANIFFLQDISHLFSFISFFFFNASICTDEVKQNQDSLELCCFLDWVSFFFLMKS